MSISTKDTTITKLRKDVDKMKKERDEVKKKMKNLLRESQQASFLESQIKDFSKTIDKLSKDTDYEKKKNSKLAKENMNLRKEMEKVQKKISGDNNPSSLKSRLGESQNKLSVVNSELSQKSKTVKELEANLNDKNIEIKEVMAYACSYITSIMTWIDNVFLTSLVTYSEEIEEDLTDKQEILRVYDSVPEILKSRKNSKSKNNLLGYLESLKTMLGDTRTKVVKKIKKERKKYATLKAQMQETSTFKDDIVDDFSRVKEDMIEVEGELKHKRAEIEAQKATIIDLKDQIKRKEDSLMDVQQDNTRFIWGVVYALFAIKQKFDGDDLVQDCIDKLQSNISLMETLSKEINDPERYKGLSLEQKKEAIMHLINVISDITTTLHSESKRLSENGIEAKELKHQIEQQKLEFELKNDQIKQDKEEEIGKLKREYEEKYDKFIEESKQEFINKEQEVNKELENMTFERQNQEKHADALHEELSE